MNRLWGICIRYMDGGSQTIFASKDLAEEAYREWKEAMSPSGMKESVIEIHGICNTVIRESTSLAFIAGQVIGIGIWEE